MSGELDDVVRGTGPEDEAVSRIIEAGLNLGTLQPEEEGIDDEFLVVCGEELFLLLAISLGPVGGVEGLNLGLRWSQYGLIGCCEVRGTHRVVVAGIDEGLVRVLAGLDDDAREVLQLVLGVC